MKKDIRSRLEEYNQVDATLHPPYATNMLVELTNICNHRCVFCANSKATRKHGFINQELLFRVLREAYELGLRQVGYYTTGEPFADKRLARFVLEAKNIGYEFVYLSTNGALITRDNFIRVINSGLDSIKFSINAGTPETYKKIHGVDDFNKVLQNVRFASEYRKQSGKNYQIYITYIVTKDNQGETDTFSTLFKPLVDDIIYKGVGTQNGMMLSATDMKIDPKNKLNQSPCGMVFNRYHITWEGYLTACCTDYQNYLVYADLNKISLKEAWYNEIITELRKKHIANELEGSLCYNCINNTDTMVNPLMKKYATPV